VNESLRNNFGIECLWNTTLVVSTSWSFPHSRLVTGFVIRVARRMPIVEQKLPTISEYLCSPLIPKPVRRRTDNIMTKQRIYSDLQSNTQKNKDRATRNPLLTMDEHICSCRKHFLVLSSFTTCHRICN
jgi:hypothetical protein